MSPGDPRDWLASARSDLVLAALDPPSGVLLEHLCFHAQQATEKALKAVLLAATPHTLPYTHDLLLLRGRVQGVKPPLPLTSEALQSLTQYAVLSRYPADLAPIDEAEWVRAVDDARRAVDWAEVIIGR